MTEFRFPSPKLVHPSNFEATAVEKTAVRPRETGTQEPRNQEVLDRGNIIRNLRATKVRLARIAHDRTFELASAKILDAVRSLNISSPWGVGGTSPLTAPPVPPGMGKFNPELFRIRLMDRMAQTAFGAAYAFVITINSGSFYAAGKEGAARRVPDQFPLVMSPDQLVNIASVSKVITAAAVLKAAEMQTSLSLDQFLDQPIWPFFPTHWSRNWEFKKITIRNCLQYRVGVISGVATEYQAIRSWCQLGGYGNSNLAWGMFGKPEWETYNNVCIAWFRYVLFYMMAPIETVKWVEATAEKLSKPPIQLDKDAFINLMAAKFYISFVRKTLLEPIGITRADMTHLSEYDPRPEPLKESTQTLYYRFPVPNVPELGFYPWDWTEIGGGGGWIISARDLSRFWAHLRYGKILSDASLGLLFSYSSPNDSFVTSARQDAWGIHFNKRGNASDGIGGYESWVWDFPGNIQLTIVSNFQTPNLGTNVIVPAYQQAWQKDKKV